MARFLGLPFLFAVAGCAASSAETSDAPTGEVPIAITTEPLALSAAAAPIHGAGRVRAAEEATLSFPFGGIASVRVARGERVRRGQILATLDASAANAQLAGARSALDKATRDAARAEQLADTVVAPVQRQDLATAVDVARAQVDAASFQSRRSVLVAPTDGVVVDVAVDGGETVGAGQPVVSFAGLGGFEVELVLPAAEALTADPGTPAVAHLNALRRDVTGVVTERAGGAGPLGGFTVVVALDDAEGLAAGLVAGVDLQPAGRPWVTVPLRSLAEVDGDDAAIYVVAGDRARRTPVHLAFLTADRAALLDPPALGTEIVVAGVPFLTDGAVVPASRSASGSSRPWCSCCSSRSGW
jgi:membrane fusion protein, multidrug efflux system